MHYQLLICDFDGTLADTFPWFVEIVNTVADVHHFKRIEPHEIPTLRGYDGQRVMQHLDIPWWKMTVVARHMRRLAADAADNVRLFPGIDRMLRTASRRGLKIAVVTSNSYDMASRILGPDLAPLVHFYECKVPLFRKGRRYEQILRASGVSPANTLAIGDELRDIDVATSVGIAFGAVGWGFTHFDVLRARQPAIAFERVDDLIAAIAG